MQLIHLEVILGTVITQISSISVSSSASDCLEAVNTCMSDLCKTEQALNSGICGDEGCQIKGSEVCNMTIHTALDRFPSLQGCVCAWEEELCGSIQELATQCLQKPVQQKRSTLMDWQSSTLTDYEGAGSCSDQIRVCVNDAICNRLLAPVLQACMPEQCDSERCQRVTQHFYGSMPQNMAEMLVMCECEASDQSCLQMKTGLQSGTCGDETWICQEAINRCVKESNCRHLLKTFQVKCWSSEDVQCSDSSLQTDEGFTLMDPILIRGTDAECKLAFLATLGTVLHHPCTCTGVYADDLRTCSRIHDVLHNRSHFMTSWKSSSGPSKASEISESQHVSTGPREYLLYTFAAVLLVGVVILMPLAVVSKIWMLRRSDRTKFHQLQKSNCVVIH
ncbi:GDNF family receptor alpha-like isoform X2 [Parambassis ranga]|uniref:GDNF family receptor alpha-like isoform X2 n=1 Tax=Parambassis ranga TaxID=210632 RepID=A0A6P7JRS7_9TELE|nr:GDNF family receptor alpha-like isoform X2 [Parambassis ranga]